MSKNLPKLFVLGTIAIAPSILPTIFPIFAAQAQVIFDGTLPGGAAPGTSPIPNGGFTYQVQPEDGLQAGPNLFHSFSQFDLLTTDAIQFVNPGVNNIVVRVTDAASGRPSSIAGTINADANFYLLNPNGLIFADDATLDITGSFIASTASGLFFNDGLVEFRAINPQVSDNSLLTIATDPGNFNQIGKTGNIELRNVALSPQGLRLGFDANRLLMDNADLIVPNGLIIIEANDVAIVNSSNLDTATTLATPAGGIALLANNQVLVDDSALFANSIAGASGGAGLIFIQGETLIFDNGTELQAQTEGDGQAGVIALRTSPQGSITFRNRSAAFSSVEPDGASLNSGEENLFADGLDTFFTNSEFLNDNVDLFYILVDTGTLTLESGATLQTVVRGGNPRDASAGWIGIAAETVQLRGQPGVATGIFSSVENRLAPGALSAAGAIVLDVNTLHLADQSRISTSIASDGIPGLVAVLADGDVVVREGSLIESETREGANVTQLPDAFPGAIIIGANRLGVTGNSFITVTNEGSGLAGDISIFANVVAVNNGSQISADTFVSGEGGNIGLAGLFMALANSSNVTTNAGGNGGNIELDIQEVIYGTPSRDNNILAQGGAEGGNIEFSESVFLRNIAPREDDFPDSNDINPSGQFSEGAIRFRSGTQDLNPVQEQVTLPTDLIDAARLIAQGCAAGNLTAAQEIGELVLTGRGGVPPALSEQVGDMGSGPSLVEVPSTEAIAPVEDMASATEPSSASISVVQEANQYVEAQGWAYGEDGEVVLTAAADTVRPRGTGWVVLGCEDVL